MGTQPRIVEEIAEIATGLSVAHQHRALEYLRSMQRDAAALPPGVPGTELLRFAGSLDAESIQEIEEVIEEQCEQVDPDAW